ncbi:hypothetical protein CDD81_4562 [Ophiocordyceps australis]|uniref:O-methyltransferase C-terminal domain-containing protein n=1 Tax=Ophiocordyceps australis TaxID=1399860 RepID=A0A2C5Y706_9HYPO|nr:hypothetical protein CDD81_4562 [Ophiocordyceps australis]
MGAILGLQATVPCEVGQLNLGVLEHQLRLLLVKSDSVRVEESQRLEIMGLLQKAARALEEPSETLKRIGSSSLQLVAAKIGQDHKLYETIVEASEPVGLEQLEHASGIKAETVDCLMEYICTQGMASRNSRGQYEATKLSRLMMEPLTRHWMTHFHDLMLPSYAALNKSLFQPDGPLAFCLAHGTKQPFYEWLTWHEAYRRAFYGVMEAYTRRGSLWLDVVDFEGEFGSGDGVAFVDVGGGIGQQCQHLLQRHPTLKGQVVLQDTPDVLKGALRGYGMQTMSYDFFSEQPIKGARVYYLRQILHNHSDEDCLEILQAQKAGLGASSVLVIDEKVLPDVGSDEEASAEFVATMGINMLVLFRAQERRESHWRRLMEQAGLGVRQVRRYSPGEAMMICASW